MKSQQLEITRQIGWPFPYPPHVTGRYYAPQLGVGDAVNAFAPSANVLYAAPILIPKKATYTAIAAHVTTLAAGNARMGIYRNKAGGCEPDALVLDAGTFTTGATGAKEIVISQELTADWYWLALVGDAAPSYRGYSDAYNFLGTTATGQTNHNHYWSVAFTYAALPNPFTAAGALANATGVPKFLLKL